MVVYCLVRGRGGEVAENERAVDGVCLFLFVLNINCLDEILSLCHSVTKWLSQWKSLSDERRDEFFRPLSIFKKLKRELPPIHGGMD
jgi:hypothetical protein